ncbi:MAG: hypothetical protein PSN34_01540 [Urechidicola sp.]|nr:hypothetical protein [Urechidicola sp.]
MMNFLLEEKTIMEVNGYYYHYINDSIISPLFLNRNGTLLTSGSMRIDKKYKYEEKFLSKKSLVSDKDTKIIKSTSQGQ